MLTTDMTYPFKCPNWRRQWICERLVNFQGQTRHDRDTRPPLQSLEIGDRTISTFRSSETERLLRPLPNPARKRAPLRATRRRPLFVNSSHRPRPAAPRGGSTHAEIQHQKTLMAIAAASNVTDFSRAARRWD